MKQKQTQTRFFTITQNAFDSYDIEIQSLYSNNKPFVYSNANYAITIEIQYILTQIGYVEGIK